MFTENQLAQLDRKYFNVILADGLDVTIQFKNTGHWWYLHCTGCEGGNAVIMFHRHSGKHPYHQHGRARSLRQAVKSIQGHVAYQMNGRGPVRR